jgi:hypothetical protein
MDIRAYQVTELSAEELQTVAGGESFWYYVGYGIGFLFGGILHPDTSDVLFSHA